MYGKVTPIKALGPTIFCGKFCGWMVDNADLFGTVHVEYIQGSKG